MKTTNFEISKKLEEAEFPVLSCDYIYVRQKNSNEEFILMSSYDCEQAGRAGYSNDDEYYYAYDLETILEALPESLEASGGFNDYSLIFDIGYGRVYYEVDNGGDYCVDDFNVDKKKDELLADTAGRLWLKLKEKGLV